MRIAICSLSQFSYVMEFLAVARRLSHTHDICYFLTFHCSESIRYLRAAGIHYEVLLDPEVDIRTTLINPVTAPSAYELFRDYFLRHAEWSLPHLLNALDAWKPDVVLCYVRDYAGATAAELLGIRIISFGCVPSPVRVAGVDLPYGARVSCDAGGRVMKLLWDMYRGFNVTLDDMYNRTLRRPHGLEDISDVSTLHSRTLVLLAMIRSLSNKSSVDPSYIKYVGCLSLCRPALTNGPEAAMLSKIAASRRPRVLITLGTIYVDATEWCVEALKDFSGTVIVSGGGKEIANDVLGQCNNVIARSFFTDIQRLLSLVDSVVTVASGKTVIESLAEGKPLICLPRQGEQYELALRLRSLGAGEVPCERAWHSREFVESVERVTTEDRYRRAAASLQIEVERAGGIEEVLRTIDRL